MLKLKSLIYDYWQQSRSYSTAYLLAQFSVLALMFISVMSNVWILDVTTGDYGANSFIAKGLFEGVLFVVFSHYILRGWLKQVFIHRKLDFTRSFSLLGLTFLVSGIHVVLIITMDLLPAFSKDSPQAITIIINNKEHILDMHSPAVWSIAITNQVIFYFAWSLGYIFWHAVKSKKELQKQMQEVRIQQLTNQLNPHFLFNAFNSIRAMIFEDKEKAADLVTQLSELFRTHLQAHLKPAATLDEEWRIAQQYLEIEKVRIEERLQVSCDFAPNLATQKLPTLTLLTLVENAVKHGISPNTEQGHIAISATLLDDKTWCLQVENSYLNKSHSKGTGTGLKNTRQRLQLMFADQASLNIEKKAIDKKNGKNNENCFIIKMELPYE